MALWVEVSHGKSPPCASGQCGSGDIMFLICHMIPQDHVT